MSMTTEDYWLTVVNINIFLQIIVKFIGLCFLKSKFLKQIFYIFENI